MLSGYKEAQHKTMKEQPSRIPSFDLHTAFYHIGSGIEKYRM